MDRRRALGVALILVSACGFGSGALFAKPVYATGVGAACGDWIGGWSSRHSPWASCT